MKGYVRLYRETPRNAGGSGAWSRAGSDAWSMVAETLGGG